MNTNPELFALAKRPVLALIRPEYLGPRIMIVKPLGAE